jgi:hypothetical protein
MVVVRRRLVCWRRRVEGERVLAEVKSRRQVLNLVVFEGDGKLFHGGAVVGDSSTRLMYNDTIV